MLMEYPENINSQENMVMQIYAAVGTDLSEEEVS